MNKVDHHYYFFMVVKSKFIKIWGDMTERANELVKAILAR